jgi:hypothetical protein
MKDALRSVGKQHQTVLHGREDSAIGEDVAIEDAGKGCGVVVMPKMPWLLEE